MRPGLPGRIFLVTRTRKHGSEDCAHSGTCDSGSRHPQGNGVSTLELPGLDGPRHCDGHRRTGEVSHIRIDVPLELIGGHIPELLPPMVPSQSGVAVEKSTESHAGRRPGSREPPERCHWPAGRACGHSSQSSPYPPLQPALCREQWSRLVGDGAERSGILAVDELEIPLLSDRERMVALTASPIVAAGKLRVNWDKSEYVNERPASGVLLGTSVLTTRIRSCAP